MLTRQNVSMSDRPNGKYCFVELNYLGDAEKAIETLDGAHLLGRRIKVSLRVRRTEQETPNSVPPGELLQSSVFKAKPVIHSRGHKNWPEGWRS